MSDTLSLGSSVPNGSFVGSLDSCHSSVTSLMSNSQYGQVIFHDIFDLYPSDCNLHFRYTLTETVRPRNGDRIAIYKVGWKHVSDHYLVVEAPIPMNVRESQPITLRATISDSKLPKDVKELYQLCYLTLDNKVIGASVPFAFCQPHESEIISVEVKAHPGLVVYKSRIAVLHDKIANLEDEKEEAELKVFTLNSKNSILEKELLSSTSAYKDLRVSYDHAKEDVNLLTANLTHLKNEFNELQAKFQQRVKDFDCLELKCKSLNSSLNSKEEELQSTRLELNHVRQEYVHADLTLKEISHYNAVIKKEIDTLKVENETLHAQISNLEKVEPIKQFNLQDLTDDEFINLVVEASKKSSGESISAGESTDDTTKPKSLNSFIQSSIGKKLNENIELQKEVEKNVSTICDLINDAKLSQAEYEENSLKLKTTIDEQCQKINTLQDSLLNYKSFDDVLLAYEEKETKYLEEIKKLKEDKEDNSEVNESIFLKLTSLEEELEENKKKHETEIIALQNKIHELEKTGSSCKVEELETVVKSLQTALICEPSLEEFCKIIFESTRVTAIDTYKDLFDSVQNINFENPEIQRKVQRLLDEFGVLKQDLDCCHYEKSVLYKERDCLMKQVTEITEKNKLNKIKMVEINETLSELRNCLNVVKKDNLDLLKEGNKNDLINLKEFKNELETVIKSKEDLEKQLKETKVAVALTNIGRVTTDNSGLLAEIELLRSKLQHLETQSTLAPKSEACCAKLTEQLNKSAQEYAKLYYLLKKERERNRTFYTLTSSHYGSASSSDENAFPSSSHKS